MLSPTTTTPSLDHLTASIGGRLIGTFAGSLLQARVPVVPAEALRGTSTGIVEPDEDGVLLLRKVVVSYTLQIGEEHRAPAEEVHAAQAGRCPNARSVSPSIEIATELAIVSPVAA